MGRAENILVGISACSMLVMFASIFVAFGGILFDPGQFMSPLVLDSLRAAFVSCVLMFAAGIPAKVIGD